MEEKIDLVYLWVDSDDPAIKEKRLFFEKEYGKNINPQAVKNVDLEITKNSGTLCALLKNTLPG